MRRASGRSRNSESVISIRRGDDPLNPFNDREPKHPIRCPPKLERTGLLQVFKLGKQPGAPSRNEFR